MDASIIYGAGIGLVGLLAGWLIAGIRSQQQLAKAEMERRLQQQAAEQAQSGLQRQQQLLDAHLHTQKQNEQELRQLHGSLAAAGEKLHQLDHWRGEAEQLTRELRNQLEINASQEAELREVTIRLEETRMAAEEKQRLLVNSEQRLNAQFENLANRIFENSGRRVDEQNRQSLHGLITPLREQLEGFRRQVQEGFGQEARERHTLAHEIRNLQQLNAQMAQEAINLTKALKGDNKTQGNWGR